MSRRFSGLALGGLVFIAACDSRPVSSPPDSRPKSPPTKVVSREVSPRGTASLQTTAPDQVSEDLSSDPGLPPPLSEAPQPKQPVAGRSPDFVPVPGGPRFPELDEGRLRVERIRQVKGTYLTLLTDLPSQPAIDELPLVFERALPGWCEYFSLTEQEVRRLHWYANLMHDPDRFRRAGLLPEGLPAFQNGFQYGNWLWLYEQDTDYYRRHLLLHEGTHGMMNWAFDGAGPGWFMEGMAELLGTHRWESGQLQLRLFPPSKTETPGWGRIKQIKEDVAAGRARSLAAVMAIDNQAHLDVSAYAWSWAAAVFFENHPKSQAVFREQTAYARDRSPRFSQQFLRQVGRDWPQMHEEWNWFIHSIEYGYDQSREVFLAADEPRDPNSGDVLAIRADRGWQSTGWRLAAGQVYRLQAEGRFQVANEPRPWIAEANGVTLRYHAGRPLGVLLAGIVPFGAGDWSQSLVEPLEVGSSSEFRAAREGVLFLRINDSPAELADNAGELRVTLTIP